MTAARIRKTTRTVTFEVKTAKPLPVGQQVFIAGAPKPLGAWRPDGLPLTRMGENQWAGHAILPVSDAIEYKITRGSWDTEAVNEDGLVPGNHELKPGGDVTARHAVVTWKDMLD